jgi:hypothetical protein
LHPLQRFRLRGLERSDLRPDTEEEIGQHPGGIRRAGRHPVSASEKEAARPQRGRVKALVGWRQNIVVRREGESVAGERQDNGRHGRHPVRWG